MWISTFYKKPIFILQNFNGEIKIFRLLKVVFFICFSLNTAAQCPNEVGASYTFGSGHESGGCDSVLGVFLNTSSIKLADVDTFTWLWGDGSSTSGSSTTNSEKWNGSTNNGVSHMFRSPGSFNVKLIITSKNGCIDSSKITNRINIFDKANTSIRTTKDVFYLTENPISWQLSGNEAKPDGFRWNFGNPSAGPTNVNNETLAPEFLFGLGPHLITLRIFSGQCDFTLLDTIQVIGPDAKIETVFNRIVFAEKFQCGSTDSVHFTNASAFYRNDNNTADEDSTVTVNGKSLFAFNYTPPSNGSGLGTGDQTPLTSAAHMANRTMGSRVVRTWNFDDNYAPQCTTSLAKGINIGVNCNFSEDEFPVHHYQSWDSIYYNSYFLINHIFSKLKYNDITNQCFIESIDTSKATLHRAIFDETIQHKYRAVLELSDTLSGHFSADTVLIDFTKPDASKMTKLVGDLCPYRVSNSNSNLQHFDLNTDGQSYFAVNYDTLTYDPKLSSSWMAFNNGGVLAPPAPGTSIPFGLPYNLVGTPGDEFLKGYTTSEIGPSGLRTPEGCISMGIIVGNGPAINVFKDGNFIVTLPATCLDTAYYHNIVNIKPFDAGFEILSPSGSRKEICAGGDAYFNINNESQYDIKTLRIDFGYPRFGRGPDYSYYSEDFYYLQPYTGPNPDRNDANITYNGEDWLYNSVVRMNNYTIEGSNGSLTAVTDTIETFVTAIIKNWKTEVNPDNTAARELLNQSLPYNEVPLKESYKLWGDGTFGCLDTTGLSSLLNIETIEYRKSNGDDVVIRGNKRYRYTNVVHTDSIEVAHILHFRDSSLKGFDTLIVDTDTTFGVWKHSYIYKDSSDGQLKILNANGAMTPTFTLINMGGCDSRFANLLNVGYLNIASVNAPVFIEETVTLLDSIRYWQYGVESPYSYPIIDIDYWNANGLETFEVEWDASNGLSDWETGINRTLKNTYTQLGNYTITMASKNVNDCRDTFPFDIKVIERPSVIVDFLDSALNPWDCNAQIQIIDLSSVTDESCDNIPCDSIESWNWSFSTGQNSTLQNPLLQVTNLMDQTILGKLVVTTANGLKDSIERNIFVPAGTSPSRPNYNYSINNNTVSVQVTDPLGQGKYAWDYGDGSSSIGNSGSNVYTSTGVYNVGLTLTDTPSQCESDTLKSVNIGGCNAYFGYVKDTASTYAVVLLDSSTGVNLSYTWDWGDGNTSTGSNPTHDYDTFGHFLVSLTVGNTNCISTYSDSIGMDANGNLLKKDGFTIKVGTVGLSKFPANSAKIYPNPSDGNITVAVKNGYITSIKAFTLEGKKVSTINQTNKLQEWKIQLDAGHGQYILIITTNKGTISELLELR
jgi:PKD repeat protein